ncbi:MAG TPA: T9SS type A sorting domain-containing protein, partial [bacterium]|nr:T9SS type A sorting domain-containing protein [bacterium]
DGAFSSEDQYNSPPQNACLDGAWQLDNIEIYVDGGGTPVFADDAESGNLGWVHEDSPATGQTGVTWWRGRLGIDFVTGRAFTCDDRPYGSWMYAAVDPFTSTLVEDEYTYLMSPPIDISGADKLACKFDVWMDYTVPSNDRFDLNLASNDLLACVQDHRYFVDEDPGGWFGGPFWVVSTDNWDAFAGNDWLSIMWISYTIGEPEGPHMAGLFLNRQLVGIPSGDAGTVFNRDIWNSQNDWFQEQISEAMMDSARVQISDDDGIVSVLMHASSDGGETWQAYSCHKQNPLEPEDEWWVAPAPTNHIVPGAEIFLYYEATDGVGNTATFPAAAPDNYIEMSILPITGSVSDQGLLLVDKHRRRMPGESRDYDHTSQYYYREMLSILGYEWDTYEVDVESGSNDQSNGPDSVGYKYYDTQIWFSNEFNSTSLDKPDQVNLVAWLQQSAEGKERNLLVTGNEIGYELIETGQETLSFYETWLASEYLANAVGNVLVDSIPILQDHAGGYDFMTHDDGQCLLTGGCPIINYFDVVGPRSGVVGNETAVDYLRDDSTTRSAGVAYTHQTLGYQTVNLGFGMEFMVDGMLPGGYFETGVWDRANLMGNILDYFGRTPEGPGTGVVSGVKNELSHAYPNPFNPMTKIAYSVKEAGPVSIEVYNVAGRVVRTLLDTEVDAGSRGYVTWDGRSDGGEKCASGVYFYRIAAPGFIESHKMIMLK